MSRPAPLWALMPLLAGCGADLERGLRGLPLLALVAACATEPVEELSLDVDGRVAPAYVPVNAEGPLPLLLMLHGYGTTADRNDRYLHVHDAAAARGMATIVPDGSVDSDGEQYWNAFASCCDFDDANVDDVAYLTGLIDQLGEQVEIDPARTYVMGYSNGGFMAFRLACEQPERFAAIAPWVGSLDGDAAACTPTEPVSLVHVRAVEDETIQFEGGEIEEHPYLSAEESASRWAALSGCGADTLPGEDRDMVRRPSGAETTTTAWQGCPDGIGVELWSMGGAGHVPLYQKDASGQVMDALLAHSR